MAGIIIGQGYSREDKLRAYKEFWAEMFPYVVKAVEESFLTAEGKVMEMSRALVKERSDFLKKKVDFLRQEMKWGKHRIRDNLKHILRAKLAGIELDYEQMGGRSSW